MGNREWIFNYLVNDCTKIINRKVANLSNIIKDIIVEKILQKKDSKENIEIALNDNCDENSLSLTEYPENKFQLKST